MTKIISIFNNKGGVGKSTICWNLADSLGRKGKRVLLIDFDPQCNLSLAVLGETTFVQSLPTQNRPYGSTIRSFLQRFLQNINGSEIFIHHGEHTSQNVDLVAGDFWLNTYADSLNVGSDLLAGTGLARYIALDNIVKTASENNNAVYDYVLIDLPPSFGSLVRAAFYASDFYIIPATSDSYSVYCIGLIGQMIPIFLKDWRDGLARFKSTNPHFTGFDNKGLPKFAGWVFNGFDTARRRRSQSQIAANSPMLDRAMNRADETMHERLVRAVNEDLITPLRAELGRYFDPIALHLPNNLRIGDIEDANVLIQNSLWQNVPLGQLSRFQQIEDLQNRNNWAQNQLDQITLIGNKFSELSDNVINICR
ncbi:ParA family protein [Leptospira yasudae]|uniref:ParA family protein n=1 Tax=Leptospira yasudae TaxID=2202201 RepID=UPI001AF00818|nr:AAA family ATPase [Leptospira yasudae]